MQRRINSSSIDVVGAMNNQGMRSNSLAEKAASKIRQNLPPVQKNHQFLDEQLRKLIGSNNNAQSSKGFNKSQNAFAMPSNANLPKESALVSQNATLTNEALEDLRGHAASSAKGANKEDKNEILSQYFASKRNMKTRL